DSPHRRSGRRDAHAQCSPPDAIERSLIGWAWARVGTRVPATAPVTRLAKVRRSIMSIPPTRQVREWNCFRGRKAIGRESIAGRGPRLLAGRDLLAREIFLPDRVRSEGRHEGAMRFAFGKRKAGH